VVVVAAIEVSGCQLVKSLVACGSVNLADGSPVLGDGCRSYVTNDLSVLKPLVEVAGECALRWIDNSSPPPAFFVHCGLGVHFLVEAAPLDLLSPTVRR
jgi:hypothetical protein